MTVKIRATEVRTVLCGSRWPRQNVRTRSKVTTIYMNSHCKERNILALLNFIHPPLCWILDIVGHQMDHIVSSTGARSPRARDKLVPGETSDVLLMVGAPMPAHD